MRELRGIGGSIEARLRELVDTGTLAELEELERETDPELVGIGRYLGLSPNRAVEIGRALGVRTVEELREAAAAGRLTEVPGIGPSTEQRLRERLAREPSSEAPRLLLGRARMLMESLAAALGATVAGDVRRWSDHPQDLALVATDSGCAGPLWRPTRRSWPWSNGTNGARSESPWRASAFAS